jgi:putative ubiquitin-RnfH superfamily antitoxin RatB of RatAB toxin-antitoxin module
MPEEAGPTICAVVVYATPRRAHLFEVRMPAGASVRQAIAACGVLSSVPELAEHELDVGIFGQRCRLDDVMRDGDRIEIYRPLIVDPKVARRQRAALKGR